jgi:NADPH2:quinone reductase
MTRVVAPQAFGGPEQLALTETQTPEPGAGEVRLAVRAIGVNPYDWKLYSGTIGRDPATLGTTGMEAAGVVEAVGDGVTDWQVGDEVIAERVPGNGYADAVVVPTAALIAKPASLPWEVAASVPVAGGTAYQSVEAVGVGDGDTVLVHGGAGAVGSVVVQLARLRGARVIATASPANHEAVRALGAEPVAYGEGLEQRVRELAPDGVDAAIDTAGGAEATATSLALVADRGRITTIVDFGGAQENGFKALGFGPGGDPGTEIRARGRREIVSLLADGSLQIAIGRTYPLTETAAAHADSQSGAVRGKLVVIP